VIVEVKVTVAIVTVIVSVVVTVGIQFYFRVVGQGKERGL
jgi:hypothetical protein